MLLRQRQCLSGKVLYGWREDCSDNSLLTFNSSTICLSSVWGVCMIFEGARVCTSPPGGGEGLARVCSHASPLLLPSGAQCQPLDGSLSKCVVLVLGLDGFTLLVTHFHRHFNAYATYLSALNKRLCVHSSSLLSCGVGDYIHMCVHIQVDSHCLPIRTLHCFLPPVSLGMRLCQIVRCTVGPPFIGHPGYRTPF